MLRMCASNYHSYTHLIQALGIVREPTVWGFITSKYPGTHDIGLPTGGMHLAEIHGRITAHRGFVHAESLVLNGTAGDNGTAANL